LIVDTVTVGIAPPPVALTVMVAAPRTAGSALAAAMIVVVPAVVPAVRDRSHHPMRWRCSTTTT
jgi:hypothetical protein